MRVVATAAAFIFLFVSLGLQAQENRSLTDFESVHLNEEQLVLSLNQNNAAQIHEQLILSQAQNSALLESLALANSELEVFRRIIGENSLSNVDKFPANSLESKLLQSVRELRLVYSQNAKIKEQLVRLSEAISILTQTSESINPQARLNVEQELRKTNNLVANYISPTGEISKSNLNEAKVVDLNKSIGLLVANVGSADGVKVGMPFQILRNKELIGSAKIIDVRERISGAVIQNLISDNMQVEKGDILKVDAKK
jgi:hypothetical protein